EDDAQPGAPARERQVEHLPVQVALAPRVGVDGGAIQAVDHRDEAVLDGVSVQGLDRDPLRIQLAPLPADLVAALAAQALQIVVEGTETEGGPVRIIDGPLHTAAAVRG